METRERLIIIGAGGHGSELASYIRDIETSTPLELLGFIDDERHGKNFCGFEILGGLSNLPDISGQDGRPLRYITAVGNNPVRRNIVERIEELGLENLSPWTLRHPTVSIGQGVVVGDGTCLAPGAILTTRIRMGRHCIVNVKASVSHDCVLGDFVNINPAATICGNVTIEHGAYVGAGATIKERMAIGEDAVIGAGSVVIQDVPAGVTVVGVPARIVKEGASD
jgi:sugar O-acyltransferase (sialic acid O-acetyltransferase NeuD family)